VLSWRADEQFGDARKSDSISLALMPFRGLVDLYAVAPLFRRQRRDGVVDVGGDGESAVQGR